MENLLHMKNFLQGQVVCLFVCLYVCLLISTCDGAKAAAPLKGPHVCGTKRDHCCFGWKLSQRLNMCISPACMNKCGPKGACISPQLCLCSNGSRRMSCLDDDHKTSIALEKIGIFAGQCYKLVGVCHHHCFNLPNNKFKCTCRHSFKLLTNRRTCAPDRKIRGSRGGHALRRKNSRLKSRLYDAFTIRQRQEMQQKLQSIVQMSKGQRRQTSGGRLEKTRPNLGSHSIANRRKARKIWSRTNGNETDISETDKRGKEVRADDYSSEKQSLNTKAASFLSYRENMLAKRRNAMRSKFSVTSRTRSRLDDTAKSFSHNMTSDMITCADCKPEQKENGEDKESDDTTAKHAIPPTKESHSDGVKFGEETPAKMLRLEDEPVDDKKLKKVKTGDKEYPSLNKEIQDRQMSPSDKEKFGKDIQTQTLILEEAPLGDKELKKTDSGYKENPSSNKEKLNRQKKEDVVPVESKENTGNRGRKSSNLHKKDRGTQVKDSNFPEELRTSAKDYNDAQQGYDSTKEVEVQSSDIHRKDARRSKDGKDEDKMTGKEELKDRTEYAKYNTEKNQKSDRRSRKFLPKFNIGNSRKETPAIKRKVADNALLKSEHVVNKEDDKDLKTQKSAKETTGKRPKKNDKTFDSNYDAKSTEEEMQADQTALSPSFEKELMSSTDEVNKEEKGDTEKHALPEGKENNVKKGDNVKYSQKGSTEIKQYSNFNDSDFSTISRSSVQRPQEEHGDRKEGSPNSKPDIPGNLKELDNPNDTDKEDKTTDEDLTSDQQTLESQNKLYLRAKMLSSMREQFLDPRMASLLQALRKRKQEQVEKSDEKTDVHKETIKGSDSHKANTENDRPGAPFMFPKNPATPPPTHIDDEVKDKDISDEQATEKDADPKEKYDLKESKKDRMNKLETAGTTDLKQATEKEGAQYGHKSDDELSNQWDDKENDHRSDAKLSREKLGDKQSHLNSGDTMRDHELDKGESYLQTDGKKRHQESDDKQSYQKSNDTMRDHKLDKGQSHLISDDKKRDHEFDDKQSHKKTDGEQRDHKLDDHQRHHASELSSTQNLNEKEASIDGKTNPLTGENKYTGHNDNEDDEKGAKGSNLVTDKRPSDTKVDDGEEKKYSMMKTGDITAGDNEEEEKEFNSKDKDFEHFTGKLETLKEKTSKDGTDTETEEKREKQDAYGSDDRDSLNYSEKEKGENLKKDDSYIKYKDEEKKKQAVGAVVSFPSKDYRAKGIDGTGKSYSDVEDDDGKERHSVKEINFRDPKEDAVEKGRTLDKDTAAKPVGLNDKFAILGSSEKIDYLNKLLGNVEIQKDPKLLSLLLENGKEETTTPLPYRKIYTSDNYQAPQEKTAKFKKSDLQFQLQNLHTDILSNEKPTEDHKRAEKQNSVGKSKDKDLREDFDDDLYTKPSQINEPGTEKHEKYWTTEKYTKEGPQTTWKDSGLDNYHEKLERFPNEGKMNNFNNFGWGQLPVGSNKNDDSQTTDSSPYLVDLDVKHRGMKKPKDSLLGEKPLGLSQKPDELDSKAQNTGNIDKEMKSESKGDFTKENYKPEPESQQKEDQYKSGANEDKSKDYKDPESYFNKDSYDYLKSYHESKENVKKLDKKTPHPSRNTKENFKTEKKQIPAREDKEDPYKYLILSEYKRQPKSSVKLPVTSWDKFAKQSSHISKSAQGHSDWDSLLETSPSRKHPVILRNPIGDEKESDSSPPYEYKPWQRRLRPMSTRSLPPRKRTLSLTEDESKPDLILEDEEILEETSRRRGQGRSKTRSRSRNGKAAGSRTTERPVTGCRDDLCMTTDEAEFEVTTTPPLYNQGRRVIDPKEIKCPEGYRRALRNQYIVCEPLRGSATEEGYKDQLCLPGEDLVELPGGKAECVIAAVGPRFCGENERLMEENGRRRCELASSHNLCPRGQELVRIGEGQGYECRYPVEGQGKRTTEGTTQAPSTTPSCPGGQHLIHTPLGPLCLPSNFATPIPGEGRALCPSGMTPQLTSIGVICQFQTETLKQLESTTTTVELTTTGPTTCRAGQVLIDTPEGPRCGFSVDHVIQELSHDCDEEEVLVYTRKGQECKRYDHVTKEENPCPMGQHLDKREGTIVCTYVDDAITSQLPGEIRCTEGQMLVETSAGFFCQFVDTSREALPVCPENMVLVKTKLNFECLNIAESKLVCSDGSFLVRTPTGYFCESGSDTTINRTTKCEPGEIFIMEDKVAGCKRLEENAQLCGKGFKPTHNGDGSFVCAPVTKGLLECPEGFYLSENHRRPECLPKNPHKELCQDLEFIKLFGNQVNCTSGDLDSILVPCEEGYEVDDVVEEGENGPMCRLVEYVEIICDSDNVSKRGIPSCKARSVQSCDDDVTSGSGFRPGCKELLKMALSGCQPQCANGGKCVEDKCVCPSGLEGPACEEDINECERLPSDYCANECINTFGSFECRCPFGSTLNADRRTCKVIDCIPDCLNGGVCVNGMCKCPEGLTGQFCQQDINECAEGRHHCQEICRNTFGSYGCVCPPGSRLATDGRSCINTTCDPECRNGGRCENHKCICPSGFYGIACQLDVNECSAGTHQCSHYCFNTRGSYLCGCPSDLFLQEDRKTCSDRKP